MLNCTDAVHTVLLTRTDFRRHPSDGVWSNLSKITASIALTLKVTLIGHLLTNETVQRVLQDCPFGEFLQNHFLKDCNLQLICFPLSTSGGVMAPTASMPWLAMVCHDSAVACCCRIHALCNAPWHAAAERKMHIFCNSVPWLTMALPPEVDKGAAAGMPQPAAACDGSATVCCGSAMVCCGGIHTCIILHVTADRQTLAFHPSMQWQSCHTNRG